MKRKILSMILSVAMFLSLTPMFAISAYADGSLWDGDGTAAAPYQISDAEDLRNLATQVNGGSVSSDTYFELTANINLNSGYMFTFDASTGLVAVNNGSADVFYLGTGVCGTGSGNQFESTASVKGSYYYLDSSTYQIIAASGSPAANSYVENTTDGTVTVYGADTSIFNTLNLWTPIGNASHAFSGYFNGGDYTVSGLYINTGADYQGLFGYVSQLEINDLSVSGFVIGNDNIGGMIGYSLGKSPLNDCGNSCTVIGSNKVGGILGYIKNSGTITDCTNSGTICGSTYIAGIVGCIYNSVAITDVRNTGNIIGSDYIGGIMGDSSNCNLTSVSNSGTVSGSQYVGGFAGMSYAAELKNCRNTGTVTGRVYYTGGFIGNGFACVFDSSNNSGDVLGTNTTGGLIGYANSACRVKNCFNAGDVSGTAYIGGLLGIDSGSGILQNSFNSGSVTATAGNSWAGGLVGDNTDSILENCYSSGNVTGLVDTGGLVGNDLGGTIKYSYWLSTTGISGGLNAMGTGSCTGCGSVASADGTLSLVASVDETHAVNGTTNLVDALNAWVKHKNSSNYNGWTTSSATDFPVLSTEWVPETITAHYRSSDGGTQLSTSNIILRQSTMYLSTYEPTQSGKRFMGWALTANSTSVSFLPGEDYLSTYNMTNPTELNFYAVWEDNAAAPACSTSTIFASGQTGATPVKDTSTATSQDPDSVSNNGKDIRIIGNYDGTAYTYGSPQKIGTSFTFGLNPGNIILPTENAQLVIYAYNVCEPDDENTIYLIDTTDAKTYYIGRLSGMETEWNSTVLTIPQSLLKSNHNYQFMDATNKGKYVSLRSMYLLIDGGADSSNITAKSVSVAPGTSSLTATTSLTLAAASTYSLEYKLSSLDSSGNTVQIASAANSITTTAESQSMTDSKSMSASLTNGSHYQLDVIIKNGSTPVGTITNKWTASSTDGSHGSSHNHGNAGAAGKDAIVKVNGQSETAGTISTSKEGNQTVTTVTVDDKKIQEKIKAGGKNSIVSIPISGSSDIGEGVLNGQTIKDMEKKESVLEIKTASATYALPASEINIDSVSSQLGRAVELKDIKISIKIAEPSTDTTKIVVDTADKNSYQIVVKPVEFEITCTSGSKAVEVSKFNGYVERTVAIPDGIDPSKITTGVVLNADGTFSHVPTTIVKIDGKHYAKINSLTNSIYSVIYNPIEFADVTKHWAKESIDNMGSRLVISGVGENKFEPDRDITRAEFAAIMVRALGLTPDATQNTFSDVVASKWYAGYVGTAASYGIISGYDADSFTPNAKITREQAMAMVARAMAITELDATTVSSDATFPLAGYADMTKISGYAKAGIIACLNTGVVTGKTASTIAPKDNITRAEVAVIIERLLKKSELI